MKRTLTLIIHGLKITSAIFLCGAVLFRPHPSEAESYYPEEDKGPSFDCRMASGKVEKAICADSLLSYMDKDLAKAYGKAMSILTDNERVMLLAEQKGFIKSVNATCGEIGRIATNETGDKLYKESANYCIGKMYSDRTIALDNLWPVILLDNNDELCLQVKTAVEKAYKKRNSVLLGRGAERGWVENESWYLGTTDYSQVGLPSFAEISGLGDGITTHFYKLRLQPVEPERIVEISSGYPPHGRWKAHALFVLKPGAVVNTAFGAPGSTHQIEMVPPESVDTAVMLYDNNVEDEVHENKYINIKNYIAPPYTIDSINNNNKLKTVDDDDIFGITPPIIQVNIVKYKNIPIFIISDSKSTVAFDFVNGLTHNLCYIGRRFDLKYR